MFLDTSDGSSGSRDGRGKSSPTAVTFSLLCFTDDPTGIDSDVCCCSFPTDDVRVKRWSGWWLKCCLWATSAQVEVDRALREGGGGGDDVRGSWCVYIDLDTVITGSMNIFKWNECQASGSRSLLDPRCLYVLSADGIVNEKRACGLNSSIMMWYHDCSIAASTASSESTLADQSNFGFLYQFLLENYRDVNQCIYKFDHYLEMMLLSSSSGASTRYAHTLHRNMALHKFIQTEFPNKVADFLSLEPRLCVHTVPPGTGTGTGKETKPAVHATARSTDIAYISEIRRADLQRGGVAVVCFPLAPKPLEVRVACPWVDEYFRETR